MNDFLSRDLYLRMLEQNFCLNKNNNNKKKIKIPLFSFLIVKNLQL